jgi:MFS family permease
MDAEANLRTQAPGTVNRLGPLGFIVVFGLISMLGDIVYEGARSVTGPFLGTLGASALVVGVVTGVGEAVGLVLRLFTGPLSDRTGRYWAITITGYAITVVAVPLLAVAGHLWVAVIFIVGERLGKAVRTPARDTMLAHAGGKLGLGRAFALHEALDQIGAFAGPLIVALGIFAVGGYRPGFALLAIPGALLLVVVGMLRARVPDPAAYDHEGRQRKMTTVKGAWSLPSRFWAYAIFTGLSMVGFATFAILAFHLEKHHVISAGLIPIVYAVAMGVDALTALASGWSYDRHGLRGLIIVPALAAAIPWLSFSSSAGLIWVGAILWGAAMGIQESTLRAAVADLVPVSQRGTGYGVFSAIYGLAWLGGSIMIGALYEVSVVAVAIGVLAAQVLAVGAFIRLLATK